MKRALFASLVLAAACNNNYQIAGSGQFVSPNGLGLTSVRDRDVIFVAGTGRDGLRALQICNLNDAQNDVSPTCSGNDEQFVPGPIRVFPANIETNNDRPLRLAGVRLTAAGVAPDGGNGLNNHAGVVLVGGADKNLLVVDAQNVVDTVDGTQLLAPVSFPLDGVAVDIVADNVIDPVTDNPSNPQPDDAGVMPPVSAFVVTAASGTQPAEIEEIAVTLDANNHATAPTLVGKCSLGAVVPTRVAIALQEAPYPITSSVAGSVCGDAGVCYPTLPAPPTDIFVADGAGDGVVRVPRSSLTAGGACAMTRISAGGRSVNSLALSPQWYEGTGVIPLADGGTIQEPLVPHPSGELLMMVTKPSSAADAGTILDPGGVVIASLCDYQLGTDPDTGYLWHACTDFNGPANIVPIPPYRYDGTDQNSVLPDGGLLSTLAGPIEPMLPINANGIPDDVTFVTSIRPQPNTLFCPSGPCNAVYVGAPADNPVQYFSLLGAVSSSDGATYFIDVLSRRFVDANFYNLSVDSLAQTPIFTLLPTLTPASDVPNPPAIQPAQPDDTHRYVYWLNPGVTHSANWRVIWHATIPGLDQRGGILTHNADGTYTLETPGDFSIAQNDPVLQFGPGDNVAFNKYYVGNDNSNGCQNLVSTENSDVGRFELQILAINGGTLTLADKPDAAFNLQGCTSLNVVAEFHTGGAKPWLVYQNFTVLARIAQNEVYTYEERRYDYPSDYTQYDSVNSILINTPAGVNEGLSFSVINDEPDVPNTELTFSIASSQAPVNYHDPLLLTGYATSVRIYSSSRYQNRLFTAITGSDSVVSAVPDILQSDVTGIQVYR